MRAPAACAALALAATLAGGAEPRSGWAVAVFPDGAEIKLEIAADPASRARGYMFRERVAPDEGMIFVFEESRRQSFWMKNCKVPLDIIFLDERFRVVEIARDVPPCPEQGDCPSVVSMRPARLVLEVAGGVAAAHGLVPGNRVEILAESPLF